jgi:hypothetical protein
VTLRIFAAAVTIAALVACGARQRGLGEAVEDPRLLVASEEIRPDFSLHQRVHATFRDRELVFQAIIQTAGGKLTIVALTPQGTRAFVLEQTGKRVTFERHVSRDLPFSPWHILTDVHRTYFRGAAGPRPDGEHTVDHGIEVMRETWQGGVLRTRSFTPHGKDDPVVTIRYGGSGVSLPQRPVTYRHHELGYTLRVTPVRFKLLTPPPDTAVRH